MAIGVEGCFRAGGYLGVVDPVESAHTHNNGRGALFRSFVSEFRYRQSNGTTIIFISIIAVINVYGNSSGGSFSSHLIESLEHQPDHGQVDHRLASLR